LQAAVSQITFQAAYLKDGKVIPTETVVWTAGVRGEVPPHSGELPVAGSGVVKVLPTLQVPGYPEVYVVGDLAHIDEAGHVLPMVAPVAIQEGVKAANNIILQMKRQEPGQFHYRDPGTMVTIGRNAAVAQIKGRSFTGFPAWVLWLGVHLFNLIGFRNRLLVLINWAWDYFFFERAQRLILPVPEDDS
jgi:NADH dehydrogenase